MTQVRYTRTPALDPLSHTVAEASFTDARDRSAPSDFHWKVLKCRMLIFSESSILACPDYRDVKQIHVIFQRSVESYKKVDGLFSKFGLAQKGDPRQVTCEVFQACLQYSITARIAPTWNLLGKRYFVNNRDFLSTVSPQQAVENSIYVTEERIDFHLKAVKIILPRTQRLEVGDCVRVFPSLNQAVVEDYYDALPPGNFKSYKDMKRHWKNIHGYRLPEAEPAYYSVRFWRGEPLTYPAVCVAPAWPLVVPVPKTEEESTVSKFLLHITTRLGFIMDEPIDFSHSGEAIVKSHDVRSQRPTAGAGLRETQAVSLCTPTQVQPASSSAAVATSSAAVDSRLFLQNQ